jgi:hypothetical protein
MKNIDLTNVQEATDFENLTTGGYIARITVAEDVEDKEYLRMEYDIADGKFKGYYGDLFDRLNFWGGRMIRSYKEKALPFFKSFITAVENSNKGYKWDSDEQKLVGKLVGIVLAEEEYTGNDGTIKTRLYVATTRSVDAIKKGDFKVPEKKTLAPAAPSKVPAGFTEIDPDDIPF